MKKIILIFVLLLTPFFVWGALININTADIVELDKIPWVGPATAQKIIDYRTSNGLFKTIEELINVNDIGDKNFLKMKDYITVSSSGGPVSDPLPDQNNNETTDSDNINDESSAHTGETSVSDYTKETLKISAGRERLATVRTPVIFSVTQNKSGKETNYFLWSFGDGTSALGAKVYHAYQFPGSYNVVLNGSIDGGEEAVARTKVLVTESNLKITAIDFMAGYIEIFNNSDKEQNLNNWSLRTGEKNHVFPLDTIISPKSAVKISLNNIGFVDQNIKEVTLVYPDGGVASIASLQSGQKVSKASGLKKSLVKAEQLVVGKVPETKSQVPRDFVSGTATTSSKNVVVLTKESSWFERIKNVLFK